MPVNAVKGLKGFQKSSRTPIYKESHAILQFTKQECGELILELMFKSAIELVEIFNDQDAPVVKQIIAGALVKAKKEYNFKLLNEMWDRAIGRIGEEITIKTNSTYEEYLLMSPEDRAIKRAEMLEAVRIMRKRDEDFQERVKQINEPQDKSISGSNSD